MPRSTFCRDPDEKIREVFFGIDCMAKLSKRTGMTEQTLGRRKRNPRELRINEVIAIIKAKKIPPEQIISVLYGG